MNAALALAPRATRREWIAVRLGSVKPINPMKVGS